MTTVLVLFGGTNSEHEVSRNSVESVLNMLDGSGYNIIRIGITKDGLWMKTEAAPAQIATGDWEEHPSNCRAFLSPERKNGGLLLFKDSGVETVKVDCVWPVLHGKYGEDGTIQGLCELAGIPYVGPGVCSSAVSMDKSQTKLIVEKAGVPQADYYLIRKAAYDRDAAGEVANVMAHFDGRFPMFVKPCSAGSSVGVTKAADEQQMKDAIDLALIHDSKVLVEETIVGREVEVAVLGNEEPKASVVGEILSANDFYDYAAKYTNAASRTVIPAEVTAEELATLQAAAVRIYSSLDCKGLSRVDFFLREDSSIIFNEINTLPGFTKISMYPKLWEASGIPNSALVKTIVELALATAE